MLTPKLIPDEFDIDQSLVSRLIRRQFPRWADLPIAKVASPGTENAIYRLGDDMAVRLPRQSLFAETVDTEFRWLPRLAPLLPLDIPVPLARGVPDDEYPVQWSVHRWLDGESLTDQPDVDPFNVAERLGRFVAALWRIDTTDAPLSARARTVSTDANEKVYRVIRELGADGTVDPKLATAIWEDALAAPGWDGPPVWIHGDLFSMNMLARERRLTAIIDFSLVGLGDPACDMLPAWTLLTAPTREVFRAASGVDSATWTRGRGWGLRAGLGAVIVYRGVNPVLAAAGQHAITETLADYQGTA